MSEKIQVLDAFAQAGGDKGVVADIAQDIPDKCQSLIPNKTLGGTHVEVEERALFAVVRQKCLRSSERANSKKKKCRRRIRTNNWFVSRVSWSNSQYPDTNYRDENKYSHVEESLDV